MKKNHSYDDDDDDFDRPSPLLQTQRFQKSGTAITKDLKTTQSKSKYNETSGLKINLNNINDDDDSDTSSVSDDDSTTKTNQSTSSISRIQSTPKPKERSFLKKDAEKPKIKPRTTGMDHNYNYNDHDDDDDDERNVFGKTKVKQSPKYDILSLRDEEERDQSFMQNFSNAKKRQSPTDMFSMDRKYDSRKTRGDFSSDSEDKEHLDGNYETLSKKQLKRDNFSNSRQSSTSSDTTQSRDYGAKAKKGIDKSDADEDHSQKQPKRQDVTKKSHEPHNLIEVTDILHRNI